MIYYPNELYMNNNKYKNKINKEKEKCNKLINKLYGDSFYFMHITSYSSVKPILKQGKLKISSNTKERSYSYKKERPSYLFCLIQFDDMKELYYDNYSPIYTFIINPKILFENDIIFNDQWRGFIIEKDMATKYISESIYINNNTHAEIINKIKTIKNIIKKIILNGRPYKISHEFLFPKDIDLKDNLLGILCKDRQYIPEINKMLDKYGYKNIPIYTNINEIPSLCDMLI